MVIKKSRPKQSSWSSSWGRINKGSFNLYEKLNIIYLFQDMKVKPSKQEIVNELVSPLLDANDDLNDFDVDIPQQKLPSSVKLLRKQVKRLVHWGIDQGLLQEVTLDDLKKKQMARKADVLARLKEQQQEEEQSLLE
eukprot:TRINITY_DN1724_c1_g1_i1.p5 TRINITY_DN1724_c1_g1~~TRINITY_DN1724_c1_g1_i1.p5  ORF type:complete len:137 (+),score=18.09 TRINITY_DN1724_c1_g1_i1:506-916(+)